MNDKTIFYQLPHEVKYQGTSKLRENGKFGRKNNTGAVVNKAPSIQA